MARYDCISRSRQEKFGVENDLWCEVPDFENIDSAAKIAFMLCKRAALIGEFIISEEAKQGIIRDAVQIFTKICADRHSTMNYTDGPILAAACVLICQDDPQIAQEQAAESTETWKLILEGLNFPAISKETGCSEQTARNRLCRILEDTSNIRFSTRNGQRFYNTLKLHSLSPVWSVRNLYDILYSFYRKDLLCSYDPDSYVAELFVTEIRRRWDADDQQEDHILRASQLSSGMRELFVNRPRYMAAVCDALLERIDRMVQGDFTLLNHSNRWDHLLKCWYDAKSDYEKSQVQRDRKSAGERKVVDRKENIRPEYVFENGNIYLCVPGIYLPGIQQPPTIRLYQNNQLIYQRRLSIYGSALLYSTRSHKIPLSGANWNQPFCFTVRIDAEDTSIYDSETSLYRDYLCFTPVGNETRLLRCSQMLRLVVRDSVELQIDDPEDSWLEDPAPFRSIRLWTESVRGIQINGREILTDNDGKMPRIWAYLTPEAISGVTGWMQDEEVTVYAQPPLLHVMPQNRADAKNYQLSVNDQVLPLYGLTWINDHFQLPLVGENGPCQRVQIKDFETGAVIYRRVFAVIPGLRTEFDKPYYLNTDCSGHLRIWTAAGESVMPFELLAGEDTVRWQMDGLWLQTKAPRLKVTLSERNALYLPDIIWHEELKDSFLTLSVPDGVSCNVVMGGKILNTNSDGQYEIGTHIDLCKSLENRADLGILIRSKDGIQQQKLTEIYYKEAFLGNPVIQEGRRILWHPQEAEFIGNKKTASFQIDLENSLQFDPFTIIQTMKPDVLERNFNCKPGTYGYKLYLISRNCMFKEPQKVLLLEGQITVSDPPENRFAGKHILLTHVYYADPVTNRDVHRKMRRNGALIDCIRYEGMREVDGKQLPEYSGFMSFRTGSGWIEFSDIETDEYEKINPVFFTLMEDGFIDVYLEDFSTIMLNLKNLDSFGAQIYSRKDELNKEEQRKYLGYAEKFRYIERED